MEGLGHTVAPDRHCDDAPQNKQSCVARRKDLQTVNRVVLGEVDDAVADAKDDIEPRQGDGSLSSDISSINEKTSNVEQLRQFQEIHVISVW